MRLFGKPFHANKSASERKNWFSRTKPWRRISPNIIGALNDKFGDSDMFEVFVSLSEEQNLVARYVEMANDPDIDVENTHIICSHIATMLCLLGNVSVRAMLVLAQDFQKNYRENPTESKRHYAIVQDAFEIAIILYQDQIQAYLGLAIVYEIMNKSERSLSYAKQGIFKLQGLKTDSGFRAYSEAVPDIAQTMEEMEKALNAIINDDMEKALDAFINT